MSSIKRGNHEHQRAIDLLEEFDTLTSDIASMESIMLANGTSADVRIKHEPGAGGAHSIPVSVDVARELFEPVLRQKYARLAEVDRIIRLVYE